MNKTVYKILGRIIKVFYVKSRIFGIQKVLKKAYSICVANHAGSFGPMALLSSLSVKLYPWVIHEVMDIEKCSSYLRQDFVENELNIKPPLGVRISICLGRICVDLMNYLKAIPVYRKSREIEKTLEMSVSYLDQGRTLIIFPENDESKKNDTVCRLDTGFIRIARRLFQKRKKIIKFFPIAINKNVRAIRIGKPVLFNPEAPFGEEKIRIKKELEEKITAMYLALEKKQKPSERTVA